MDGAQPDRRLLGLAVAATAGVAAFRFLHLSIKTLGFPYPLDYGEGAILDGALRLSRFESIYPARLTSPPWFVSNYPPIDYLVHVPFIWLMGPALWYGRLVSQLSAVATATLIGAVVTGLTLDVAAGVLAALTFVAIPIVAAWSQYDRVDMLACALTWLGVWLVVARDRAPRVGPAALCFLLASFTRQTAAIPAVIGAYAWLRSRGSASAANRLVLSVGGVGLAGLVLLDLATSGGFVLHVVSGTVGRFDPSQLQQLARELVFLIPILLAIAAGLAAARLFVPAPGWTFAVVYVAASAAMSLAVAREGSYINYFLDLCAACSLAAGLAVAWARPRPQLAAAIVLLLTIQAIKMGRDNALYDHLAARLDRGADYAHLASIVANERGAILADEPLALLPLSGRTIELQPFAMTQMAHAGLWDPSPVLQRLRRQQYALLLLRMPRRNPDVIASIWERSMADAIREHYETAEEVPVDEGAVVAVMRPRLHGDDEISVRRTIRMRAHPRRVEGRRNPRRYRALRG